MTLAITHRPDDIDDLAGNKVLKSSLKSVLDRDLVDIPHAFLFVGQRGCGKTTLSRIVKEKLGCADEDFTEVDSAQFRKLDDIRTIRKNMMFAPMKGEVRVWLLDECHMIGKGGNSPSNEAQNALLKALEDPPPYVYFILATTNPEMLIPTIRSRCTTFSVESLSPRQMVEFLRDVAGKERKRVHPDILKQIAMDSMGSPRDALQILEKIIDLPLEEMKEAAAQQAAAQNQVIDLCRALMAGPKKTPWKKVVPILTNLLEDSAPEDIRRAVTGYCCGCLLRADNPQAFVVYDCFREPFPDNTKNGVIGACYDACEGNR